MAPSSRPPAPLPAGCRLRFAPDLRRPVPTVLIGGAPLRVLRLTPTGSARVDKWLSGAPVGTGSGGAILAARLVEGGLATPEPPAERAPLSVAVVIPVRDDQSGLDLTLDALARTAPDLEVVVVDDGSAPAINAPGAKVVRRPVAGGPAAARNTGWKAADAPDVIAFVDAGCVAAAGWLETLLAHFADQGLAAAAPRIEVSIEPGTPPALARYERRRSPLDLGPSAAVVGPGATVSYVPSTVLLVRRADLIDAGGFDESMRFGEDVDLVWRLRAAGRRVLYSPSSTVTHPARRTWGRWLRQRFDYGTAAADLAARHGRAVAPLSVSPWSTAVWGLVGAGHPVAGAALLLGSSAALARRGGNDPAVKRALARLALTGTARSGPWLITAVRRAWLPPAIAVGLLSARRAGRSPWRRAALALAVAAGPDLGRGTLGVGLADDVAYQAGVWAGVIRRRSLQALLPRW